MKHGVIGLACVIGWLSTFAAAGVPVVAHRGASADAPENTMASFRLAWQQGADAIETDVWMTADGQLVCMHDGSAKRTTGVDRELASMTLAEVRALDAGVWKGAAFAGERVPTLDEVLASLPAGKRFFIEIKAGPEIVPAFAKALDAYRSRWADLRVIGFDAEVIALVKRRMPGIGAFWLTSFKPDAAGVKRPTPDEVLATLDRIKADGLDAKADLGVLDAAFVRRLHEHGYGLHVWTVDDPAVAAEAVRRGAESITTNTPGVMRKAI